MKFINSKLVLVVDYFFLIAGVEKMQDVKQDLMSQYLNICHIFEFCVLLGYATEQTI
jgi:hypothetical protein